MTNCLEYRWQKGNCRYYRILIYKDLLNDWVITCIWGGMHNRLGNFKHLQPGSIDNAMAFVKSMGHRRKSRGYELIGEKYV